MAHSSRANATVENSSMLWPTFQSHSKRIDAWANETKLRWPTRQSHSNWIDSLGTCLVASKKSVGPRKSFQNGLFCPRLPHFSILGLVGLLYSRSTILGLSTLPLRQTDYFFNSLRPYCSPVSLLFFRPSSNPL